MKQPPYDADGKVEPHDHDEIGSTHGVIRRVSEQFVVTEADGIKRLSSMAFQASSGEGEGMSVDLQGAIEDAGEDPIAHVTSPIWIGSVRFSAQQLREEELQVGFDPIPDNPFHGQVWGNFNKSKRKRLKSVCEWFVSIPNVELG